ncbi:MAG: hypothetical protein PHO01_02860 [Desulfotomaculaceae bacterium]|nr:hypothetical protein [Desulfotomaculaceae bacterium]
MSPYETAACGDWFYSRKIDRPGIYEFNGENKISIIYDFPADNLKLEHGKLYFLTDARSRQADDRTELPFRT